MTVSLFRAAAVTSQAPDLILPKLRKVVEADEGLSQTSSAATSDRRDAAQLLRAFDGPVTGQTSARSSSVGEGKTVDAMALAALPQSSPKASASIRNQAARCLRDGRPVSGVTARLELDAAGRLAKPPIFIQVRSQMSGEDTASLAKAITACAPYKEANSILLVAF